MNIYIKSCAQISVQEPLCDKWFTEPIKHEAPYVRALDPDYKPFINPVAARRMGLILKRAMATSITALKEAELAAKLAANAEDAALSEYKVAALKAQYEASVLNYENTQPKPNT